MIVPTSDRVLVIPDKTQQGVIIVPENAKEKPDRGTVYSVGPGKRGEPMEIKQGQVVLFVKGTGQSMIVEGQDMVMMREESIIAIEQK